MQQSETRASFVPPEFVGHARSLRSDIEAAEIVADLWVRRIWQLVAASTHRRAPLPAVMIERLWRTHVPQTGQLSFSLMCNRNALRIVEDRLTSSKFRFLDWPNPEFEPSVAYVRMVMTAAGGRSAINTVTQAEFSLHSLARRFQRGAGGAVGLGADVLAMAAHRDRLLAAGGDFVVPLPEGRWVGSIAKTKRSHSAAAELIVAVRSFLPERETP